MITTRIYLDKRATKKGEEAPLKICISRFGSSAYISVGVRVLPSQWDKRAQKIIDHPERARLNLFLQNRKTAIDGILYDLYMDGGLRNLTPAQIRDRVLKILQPERQRENLFIARFETFGNSHTARRTREIYESTRRKILEYDPRAESMTFEDIKKEWVNGFAMWMQRQGLAKNTINIHLRNLRAVINDAIDNEVTTHYPMRKIDMTPEATKKRSLSAERLRDLLTRDVEPWQERYRDYFILTFCLIGVNPVDLLHCTENNVQDSRLVYQRAKTGRWYSIRIEPEAQDIIDRYRGKRHLLTFLDEIRDYRVFTAKCDKGLQTIGEKVKVPNAEWSAGSKKWAYHTSYIPAFPSISIYWARHTWATIAYSLDIPDETIAAALGHSHGNKTTAIYIDKSIARIDEANRRVLDFVFSRRG